MKAKFLTGVRCAIVALVLGAAAVSAGAAPLPPSAVNVELVSSFDPGSDSVGDVASLGDFAYLVSAPFTCANSGVRVVDLSDPLNPSQAAFIPAAAGSPVTRGVQVAPLATAAFSGDVLAHNNSICGTPGARGGFSLWDVTDPRAPRALALNVGDTQPTAPEHATESVFIWQQGASAYAAALDIQERNDLDIFDITNPTAPVQIADLGLDAWPETVQGDAAFPTELQVRQVGGHWRMIVAYLDAGVIVLDVDNPAHPVFVDDSDFPEPDSVYGLTLPDGNSNYAEWDSTGSRIVTADDDSRPTRLQSRSLKITTGPNADLYRAAEFSFGKPILHLADDKVNGPTVYGGYGCSANNQIPFADTALPPGSLAAGEEQILVVQRGPINDPAAPYLACTFQEKASNAVAKGYEAVVIANHHSGAGNSTAPDAEFCGAGGADIHMICVGHRAMHLVFDDSPDYDADYTPNSEPAIGTLGQDIEAVAQFDGWGYVRVLDGNTLAELDAYAISEARDVNHTFDSGNLSTFEVATDPTHPYAYTSWHAGGLRVLSFASDTIVEAGRFVGAGGIDIQGVQVHIGANGDRYVLATDPQAGLYVFRYGADLRLTMGGPATATVGQEFAYTLQLTNGGTTHARDVLVTDALPAGTTAVGATSSQGSCGSSLSGPPTITCNLGTLPKGESAGISITVRAHAPGTITNTVSASTTDVDPSPRNDSSSTQTIVTAPPAPPPAPAPPPPPARPAPRCRVPNVVGTKLAVARQRIRRANCAVGRVRRAKSRRPAGRVVRQSPRPRTTLRRGGRVNLVVSRGRR